MGEPERKLADIEPEIRPNLGVIDGDGESTPRKNDQLEELESNPEKTNSGSVADQEAAGSNVESGQWKDSTTGNLANLAKPGGIVGYVKQKSPILAIILTLMGFGGIGFAGYTITLPQNIMAHIIEAFNPAQETSATMRARKIMAAKTAENVTTESCATDIIKITCRFQRPSNRFLKQLEKNGIVALDAEKNPISKTDVFPNKRPKYYQYKTNSGEIIDVDAKNIYSTLKSSNNAEFLSAFNKATKTRFMTLADSVAASIRAKYGVKINNELKTATTDTDLAEQVDDIVDVDDDGIKAAVDGGDADAAEDAVKKIFTEEATDATNKIAKSGKGDTVGLVSGAICLVTDVPGLIIKTNRAFQISQVIKYATPIASAFGAIKAGDATPEQTSALLGIFTKSVNGKSAMDSFGMKYIMTGDITPNSTYTKFSPGLKISKALSGVTAITNNQAKTKVCSVMTNPVTGQAINVALAANAADTLGTSLVVAAANIVVGLAASELMEKYMPGIIDTVVSNIPAGAFESILTYFYGDLTKGLAGEDVGDAMVSGMSHLIGQTANAGGNMPLTVDQAVAYNNLTKEVQLAYAREDQATKSPFDISSPYTMMGSLVRKFMPYYSSSSSFFGSAASTFSTVGKIISGSFSTIMQPLVANAESNPTQEYKLCEDPEIANNDIAAGPYCNIMYGIPVEYLDRNPVEIVNRLVASGDIDPDSGEPLDRGTDLLTQETKLGLKSWLDMCADGTTYQADSCKVTEETADYALYTIDHRIQISMDEEEETTSTSLPSSPSSTGKYDSMAMKQLAQAIIDSKNVTDKTGQIAQIAAGTRTNVNIKVLRIIAELAEKNKFAVASLFRDYVPKGGSTKSQHLRGEAVDISGSSGINGVVISNYTDYNATIQTFVKETASLLGDDCHQIGVPNSQYESGTTTLPSQCSIFTDIGTGPHIHIGINP